MDLEQAAIERLKMASEMSLRLYKQPLVITYSGGKDSDVLLHLAGAAGIPYVVHGDTVHRHPLDAAAGSTGGRRQTVKVHVAKVYIAGKITGDPGYHDKFREAEVQLHKHGYIVLNPAELPEGMSPADYMRICLAMIDVADAVVFLPGAADSAGARLEKAYCKYIGKEYEIWTD